MTGDPLRVLHLVSTNQRRGAETFALDMVAELDRRGISGDLRALTAVAGDDQLQIPALPGRRFDVRGLAELRRLARRADVAVAHGSSTLPAMALATVGLRTPFVYRGIGEPLYWSNTAARRVRSRWSLRRAAGVSAIWSGAASDLVEHLGVEPRKVRVIPRGVPADRFPVTDAASRAAARRRFGLPETGPILAMVGALAPEKRIDLAIDALARVPDAHLVVAGDGPDRADLERRGQQLTGSRCAFLGRVPDPAAVYAAADALLLTSDSEGIPGVVIEAAFTGLPCVATRAGGVVDVIDDHVTGVIVERGDVDGIIKAIHEVLPQRGPMGSAARAFCLSRFELVAVVDRWATFLADVSHDRAHR